MLAPHRDAFVLHASDGLWGAVGDQEAVDCAAAVIQSVSGGRGPGGGQLCAWADGTEVLGRGWHALRLQAVG